MPVLRLTDIVSAIARYGGGCDRFELMAHRRLFHLMREHGEAVFCGLGSRSIIHGGTVTLADLQIAPQLDFLAATRNGCRRRRAIGISSTGLSE
jgi:hypothetical protein